MAIKIIVTIDIGRKSLNCTRFGVCSITVGAELALKPNQDVGVIEWEQGASTARLHWRGKETLAEQGICQVPIDRAVYLPLPCSAIDWHVRPGKYSVFHDDAGGFIELQLSAVHAVA